MVEPWQNVDDDPIFITLTSHSIFHNISFITISIGHILHYNNNLYNSSILWFTSHKISKYNIQIMQMFWIIFYNKHKTYIIKCILHYSLNIKIRSNNISLTNYIPIVQFSPIWLMRNRPGFPTWHFPLGAFSLLPQTCCATNGQKMETIKRAWCKNGQHSRANLRDIAKPNISW